MNNGVESMMKRRGVLACVVLAGTAMMVTGCVSQADVTLAQAAKPLADRVLPEYQAYVAADATLTDTQKGDKARDATLLLMLFNEGAAAGGM